MYRPTDLHHFLNEQGLKPKKGLSQNFLIDGNIIQKILSTASVKSGDKILEIGPGPGALTQALLQKNVHLFAVEKDQHLALALERFKQSNPESHLDVYCEDILDFLKKQPEEFRQASDIKVIANLPYHLTTPILVQLIEYRKQFSSITIMVQLEVAKRFCAKSKTKDFGSISLFLQFFADVEYAFTVKRTCFHPAPSVDSAVVHLKLKQNLPDIDLVHFFQLTRTAFQQRRKMLKVSLKQLYTSETVEKALSMNGLLPTARPEELSLNEFLDLYQNLIQLSFSP